QQSSRRRHDHCRQQAFRVRSPHLNVGGHHATGNMRHAAGHYDHQLGLGKFRQKWTNREWSFGLAHENAGCNVEGFGAAGAHDARHDPGGGANDELHDTDVVENGEERGDENNGGKNLECEGKTKLGSFFRLTYVTKNECGAYIRVAEKFVRGVAEQLKQPAAAFDAQYKKSQRDLQTESPK